MSIAPIVLAGACVGAGVTIIVTSLLPRTPDLRAALARLDGDSLATYPPRTARESRFGVTADALRQLADSLRLARYREDLELLGERPEDLAVRKVGYGLLGLLLPPLLAAMVAVLGMPLPFVVPAFVSLTVGTAMFFVPDVDLRRRATSARDQMRRAVCVYLELVALERAADAGAVEALERAASIGDSPAFVAIRDALLRAELAGRPPWQGLGELAEQIGVAELGDVADMLRLSGEDGAAVYSTLRARASSLRTQLLAADAAQANAASEHMVVPVALLGVAFMALIGYPAFARILFS